MKHRYLKLKEAHRACAVGGGGSDGGLRCSIVWDGDGSHLVTASSIDPAVLIHFVDQPAIAPKVLQHHKLGVTALAMSPNSRSLATGSMDRSVKIYSFPDGEFQSNVTRFTLPIRSLAFNKSGSLLAAAGDDDGIKLIATVDNSISRVLKGHTGPVIGLSFDPKNEFLASIDSVGTVIYWELSSGNAVHTLKSIAPNCLSDYSFSNTLSWCPDGETLAIPGLKNDVVMYDRDTAEKLFSLKGDHEQRFCYLSWSPNGKYMTTSGMDNQVLIWDIDLRQDIKSLKFDDQISCLVWNPIGNSLAVIDVKGRYGIWESVIPSTMKSPTDGGPNNNLANNDFLRFDDDDDDDDDEEKRVTSGSLDDFREESNGESEPVTRRRLSKHSSYIDSVDEDSDGEDGLLRQIETHKKTTIKPTKAIKWREKHASSLKSITRQMQEAFQPGCTPIEAGKRRFLAYTMLGSITTMLNDGYSHIEIDFHDTGIRPRIPSTTDYFGFTMAALNENGSVFSNPCKGEKQTSTLMYRPFSSWANNSEWSMRFEAEEVKAVALGIGWVAAVTSLNYLRIFSDGGLQRHILCINGPVVTMAGFKDELAVVSHVSDVLSSGDQVLEVMVINIGSATMPLRCRLPLSPDSSLTWFGFSEEGRLSTFDSKGVLRVFFSHFGGTWLPLFSARKAEKSDEASESYWVVGLNSSELYCIVCKSPDFYPSVLPKPVLKPLSLSFPLASSDLGGADSLENEFMLSNLHLSQIQKKIEEMSAACRDTTHLENQAFSLEAVIDRCILRLIASCCNGDKLVRATELAGLLVLEKSLKGAIKLVTALKLPVLAKRFNDMLEERMLSEPRVLPGSLLTNKPSECAASFLKKEVQEEDKVQMLKGLEACRTADRAKTTTLVKTKVSEEHGKSLAKSSISRGTTESPVNPRGSGSEAARGREASLNTSNDQEMPSNTSREDNCTENNLSSTNRHPVNPFAKLSSTKQGQASLFDSIKNMKRVDTHKIKESGSSKKIKI